MASKYVKASSQARGDEVVDRIVVQGFREGVLTGVGPVVAVAVADEHGKLLTTLELTPEDAQILGEYLREQAEFAVRNEEEDK